MSQEPPAQKLGQGHAAAWFRAGFKELGQIFPALPNSIKNVEEPGLYGNPVSQEVYQQRKLQEPTHGNANGNVART